MNKTIIQEPKNPIGYTSVEMKDICNKLNIEEDEFNNALGCNTGMLDKNTGECLTYQCDVENALNYIAKGKYLFFD